MDQYLKVSPSTSPLDLCLEVPTSKSHSNRLLILAAQSARPVTIHQLSNSSDVITLLQCLKKIGVSVEQVGKSVTIQGPFPLCEIPCDHVVELQTGDGGTTNRFLLPLLANGQNRYRLIPSERMRERPNHPLIAGLRQLGAEIVEAGPSDFFWLEVKGQGGLRGACTIDCGQSTQFASGLLMATINNPLPIEITGLSSSKAYLQITKNLIAEWLDGVSEFWVPVDSSSLSYPMALGAVLGRVTISNCFSVDPEQADSVLLELFTQWGIPFFFGPKGLTINRGKIPAFKLDCSSCPDLTPTLSFLAAFSEGETLLTGLEVLRHKESDRLAEICRLLETFEIEYQLDENTFQSRIFGKPQRQASFRRYLPPPDHRLVMSGYLFMRALGGGELAQTHHVAKSFPDFFSQMSGDRAI